MKLRCTSDNLNVVAFDGGTVRKVRKGDTFVVGAKTIPAKWRGMVEEVKRGRPRMAVTNPAGAMPSTVSGED
jgi:hypothetical protein